MQDDGWKKTLSELSLDELKEAQRFINELIPMLQAVENPTEAPTEALTESMVEEYKANQLEEFPPSTGGERREDTRFDIDIDGVYAIIKGEEAESELQMLNLQIKDVSKQGIRFVTNQFVLPSNILIIKFHLPSSNTRQLYKKIIQKKIYAEVRRVVGIPTPRGMQYQVGAKSIEREEALELAKENEGFTITGKRLALKSDMTVLIVSIREAHAKHLETLLRNLGYNTYRESQKPYAIATLRKINCNIVVTDMVTACIQEFELIKDLKNEFPEISVIIEVETLEDWFQMSSLGVDEYISKNFTDKEFERIVELLHKKILQKNIFGNYFHNKDKNRRSCLVVGTDSALKKYLCKTSLQKNIKFYFVPDTSQSMVVLKKFKVDLVFIDSTVASVSECSFIAKARKDFPNIEIFVISRNYLERHRFLISGADRFFIAQMGVEQIAEVL